MDAPTADHARRLASSSPTLDSFHPAHRARVLLHLGQQRLPALGLGLSRVDDRRGVPEHDRTVGQASREQPELRASKKRLFATVRESSVRVRQRPTL